MPELSSHDASRLRHHRDLFWSRFHIPHVVQRKLHYKSHSLTYLRLSEMGPSTISFGDTYIHTFFEILENLVEQEIAAQRACDHANPNKMDDGPGAAALACGPRISSEELVPAPPPLPECEHIFIHESRRHEGRTCSVLG